MKKKVIEFVGGLGDGGAETIVKDYSLLLDKEKFDVYVLVYHINQGSANYKILSENGVKIIPLFKRSSILLDIINHFFPVYLHSYCLKKIVNKIHPDIMHVHQANLHALKSNSNLLKNVKLIYTCHSLPEKFIGKEQPRENQAADFLIRHNNLQMIALHADMAKEINAMFGIKNTIVINNGVDFNRYRSIKETKRQIRESISIPEDALILGHVGRFAKVKNHEMILKVFDEVRKKEEKAWLLLIGNGPLEEDIYSMIKDLNIQDRVTILSHRTDVPRLLKAMDVFVFPSFHEGLSVVCVEAQVSGLRCLLSDRINPATFMSKQAIPMNISLKPSEWAEEILHPSRTGLINSNMNDFDMNKEIKNLEQLYLK